jgi:hypothetical protein
MSGIENAAIRAAFPVAIPPFAVGLRHRVTPRPKSRHDEAAQAH